MLQTFKEIYRLRKDRQGIAVGAFVAMVIGIIVLVVIVSALMGTLKTNLVKYAANETTLGSTVQTVAPLLISAAILLTLVYWLIERKAGQEG
jgi:uncharacterized BrkB/YihY/UPF0761 family membrane protein